MRTRMLTMSAAALALAALTAFGQDKPIASQTELRASLAAAKTPADHASLAAYYRRTAQTWAQKQAEEEQIAARWRKQYENWSKTPNPYSSARNLGAYYGQRAHDALTRAAEQDRLAGNQAILRGRLAAGRQPAPRLLPSISLFSPSLAPCPLWVSQNAAPCVSPKSRPLCCPPVRLRAPLPSPATP